MARIEQHEDVRPLVAISYSIARQFAGDGRSRQRARLGRSVLDAVNGNSWICLQAPRDIVGDAIRERGRVRVRFDGVPA